MLVMRPLPAECRRALQRRGCPEHGRYFLLKAMLLRSNSVWRQACSSGLLCSSRGAPTSRRDHLQNRAREAAPMNVGKRGRAIYSGRGSTRS